MSDREPRLCTPREFTFQYGFPWPLFIGFASGVIVFSTLSLVENATSGQPHNFVFIVGALLIGLAAPVGHFIAQRRLKQKVTFTQSGISLDLGSGPPRHFGLAEMKGFQAFSQNQKPTMNLVSAHSYVIRLVNSEEAVNLQFRLGFRNWALIAPWLVANLEHLNSNAQPSPLSSAQKSVHLNQRAANECAFWIFGSSFFGVIATVLIPIFLKPLRAYETTLMLAVISSPITFLAYRKFYQRAAIRLKESGVESWRLIFIQIIVIAGVEMSLVAMELSLNKYYDSTPETNYSQTVDAKEIVYLKSGPGYRVRFASPSRGHLGFSADDSETLYVSAQAFKDVIPQNSRVTLVVKQGLLGIPWRVSARLERQ
jgi:hypothetical protein